MTDEDRQFNGNLINGLCKLGDEVLAAYNIQPGTLLPADEVQKRTAALYEFRRANERDVVQEGD